MVSLQTVQYSNARIATLPKGLVALFIGATSGIGQAALKQFVQSVTAARIYSVARQPAVTSHENTLASLRQENPSGTYSLIAADVSLIAEVDRVVEIVKQKETKLDLLFMSPGFMAFEGRKDTSEGLEPSMTTRYYSRQRAVEQLLPLLNSDSAVSPRIISVLAAGMEGPLKEDDLDLKDPTNWHFWNASVHAATMSTLALEYISRENPRLSITHWLPGAVATPGLAIANKFGINPPNPVSEEFAGAYAVFLATNDRYAVHPGGLVPVPEGLEVLRRSGGGIFLVGKEGESTGDEQLLGDFRKRHVDEAVWKFTQKVFNDYAAKSSTKKEGL
ncbi:hypothetical protein B0O99DRAFT_617800 [Bisporella sp. PMI_857]|nr:hypothetical protein B0O99DRAFT_617800 [Bisporella sp. PMI_857]